MGIPVDHDTIQSVITIDDPMAYEQPWTALMAFSLREGVALAEFSCQEGDNLAFEAFERQLLEYGTEQRE
jgi:hypothetical protein